MGGFNIYILVEDDENISRMIDIASRNSRYDVSHFSGADELLSASEKKTPDLILIDTPLADCDVSSLVREIETSLDERPSLLILKRKGESPYESQYLTEEDFLDKPFKVRELTRIINARYRKSHHLIGDLYFNPEERVCKSGDKDIKLTRAEFIILDELIKNSDEVVSRDRLLEVLWGEKDDFNTRTIDVHIRNLRKKLGPEGTHIKTVYRVGYRFIR